MFASLRTVWVRVGRWPRLLAAGACLALALLSAAGAAHRRAGAATPASTTVVLARHAVAAGAVLRASDVAIEHWPRRLHPVATVRRPADAVGRRVAGPLVAREPITSARLVGRGLTNGLAAGLGAVSVPVAGAQLPALVHAGDHVDVLGPEPVDPLAASAAKTGVEVVADDAPVLTVLPGTDGSTSTVVIAGDRSTAVRVARAGTTGSFTVVVTSP